MVLMVVVWHTYLKFLFFDLELMGTGLTLTFEDPCQLEPQPPVKLLYLGGTLLSEPDFLLVVSGFFGSLLDLRGDVP